MCRYDSMKFSSVLCMKKIYWLVILLFLLVPFTAWSGCPEDMKPVPRGKFKMGFRDEIKKTDGFCMDIYEVTVKQFKAYKPDYAPHKYSSDDDAPVTHISHKEARGYCKSQGKRLPTQEEWEKACRGPKNWKYPYGNEFDGARCRTNKVVRSGALPVGSFPKCVSAYGIFDMSGNVMEWTGSPYGKKKNYVLKGGGWTHSMTTTRCSARFNRNPKDRFSNTGFRCVK